MLADACGQQGLFGVSSGSAKRIERPGDRVRRLAHISPLEKLTSALSSKAVLGCVTRAAHGPPAHARPAITCLPPLRVRGATNTTLQESASTSQMQRCFAIRIEERNTSSWL